MIHPLFNALSDLERVTEEQYLLREFRIKIRYGIKDHNYKLDNNLIVSDNPENWHQYLSTAPSLTINFILIGNETYQLHKYHYLNQFSSIKSALIYNPPRPAPYYNILKSLIGNLLDGGTIPTDYPGSVFRDFRNSQFTRNKLNSIQIKYPFVELPQGYCNSFVDQLSTLSPEIQNLIETNISLYSAKFKSALKPFINKTQTFSYLGQSIHHRRATCLRIAKKEFGIQVPSKVGFGGLTFDGDTTYLNNLLKTKFPLVPPGAFNNYNHRYTEALITGGLPAILAQNSLDPSINSNWTNDLRFPKSHSFRFLLKYLSEISTKEFEDLQKTSHEKDFAQTQEALNFFLSNCN